MKKNTHRGIITIVLLVTMLICPLTQAATMGEANALHSARIHLSYSSYSYEGLIDQLKYEGYTTSEATYAAEQCGADWYEQAVKTAENYLSFSAFSEKSLIDQLKYEGFTQDQAVYGVQKAYGDSKIQAIKSAEEYLASGAFSYNSLINQLIYEGFSTEDATHAADCCGANWFEQAAKSAESYLSFSSFSRQGLINQLVYEGFTTEQAEFGVNQAGYTKNDGEDRASSEGTSATFATASQPIYQTDKERFDAIKKWPYELLDAIKEKYPTTMVIERFDYGLLEDFRDVAFFVINENDSCSIAMALEEETYTFRGATIVDEVLAISELVRWFRGYQLHAKEMDMNFWVAWTSSEFTSSEMIIINESNYKEYQSLLLE